MRRRQIPGEPPPPSKGELRRQALSLLALGDELIDGPEALLAGLPLPEKLREAVAFARRIRSHGALLRQRRYVARLLRDIDTEPLRTALAARASDARAEAARFRQVERWRDRLIEGGTEALDTLVAACPAADRSVLAGLIANAGAERADGRPAGAARALFRYLRACLAAAAPAAAAASPARDRIRP